MPLCSMGKSQPIRATIEDAQHNDRLVSDVAPIPQFRHFIQLQTLAAFHQHQCQPDTPGLPGPGWPANQRFDNLQCHQPAFQCLHCNNQTLSKTGQQA